MKSKYAVFFLLLPVLILGQNSPKKEVNVQTQSWIALIASFKIDDRWGIATDVHMRRNDFAATNSFVIVRAGASYEMAPSLSGTIGYAHLWLSPSNPDWSTIANENRIYQQLLYSSKIGNITLTQRIRNEQRWQEVIANDQKTDALRFTNRVRYLLGCTIPISSKKSVPSIVISDEILFQFGKDVVYNTFDQNRIFVGIRQALSPSWSYDFGYMQVFQQKASGYQYDQNHTLRLFFYYNRGAKSHMITHHHASGDE